MTLFYIIQFNTSLSLCRALPALLDSDEVSNQIMFVTPVDLMSYNSSNRLKNYSLWLKRIRMETLILGLEYLTLFPFFILSIHFSLSQS
jgi:hypothetical protein